MSKRTLGLLAAGGLVAAAWMAVSSMPAASQQGSRTIALCEPDRGGYDRFVDVGKKGFSPGDHALFVDRLYRRSNGTRWGKGVGSVTVVRTKDGLWLVDYTMATKGGKISSDGFYRDSELRTGFKSPITGGTGAYDEARGTVALQRGKCKGGPGLRFTLQLIL